jgi:glycosyltransferase involved in cell wall biosynthesis
VATACWSFPIYSQTFVYQELTQLIRRGFNLRFLYSKLDREQPMPSQFSRLWRARRRLILHQSVCEQSYDYFLKRMPEKIDALVDMLCRASGMTPQEVRGHHHFLQAFPFTRMVEAYRPDYVHSYFFYEGTLFGLIAAYLLDIPRGVSCYADHMLKDYTFKAVPLHLRQCSLVIATSHRIKQELVNIAPQANPDRIIVKPNAINTAQFPIVDRKEPKNGQPYRLVSVSRIEPKKGLVYLAEAVGCLRDRGVDVELHLIGGVDDNASSKEYAHALEARIREMKLGGKVHTEGRKSESEIKQFLKDSHLFVAPFVETESGDKDGIPTSLLEAMSTGLPAVATDAGSIPEVITDGRDGVLVSQHDAVALGRAIETLLRDPDRRQRLGREAADSVRRRFDVRACEEIFHERLRSLIDEGHSPDIESQELDGEKLLRPDA